MESGHQGFAEKGGFIWRAGLFILFWRVPRIQETARGSEFQRLFYRTISPWS